MKSSRKLPIALALIASSNSFACTIPYPPPQGQFENSQAVVLAVPEAMSFRPKEASKRAYRGPFRQTILWHVLISWKGEHKAGSTFTTRQEFSAESGCGSLIPFYDYDVQLLYLRDREPYSTFRALDPSNSAQDFKFLESRKKQHRSGT